MPINSRVFWPIEQLAIKNNAAPPTGAVAPRNARHFITGPLASGVNQVSGLWEVPRGMQSVSISTTFNTEQVFQLGQIELYEYSERQPDVEISVSKAIDGSKPVYFMVTDSTSLNDIVARTNIYRTDLTLQIYPDTQFRSTGRPQSIVTCSGFYMSNVAYTFPIDGMVTEDITLVGNDKIWGLMVAVSGKTAGNNAGNPAEPLVSWPSDQNGGNPNAPEGTPSGVFGHDGLTSTLEEGGAQETAGPPDRLGIIVVGSGIQRREDVDLRRSILPADIPGVITPSISGIDGAYVNGGFGAQGPGTALGTSQLIANANTDNIVERIQTITISFSVARTDIFELGSKRPYVKVPAYPLEATTSIEVITSLGDQVDAVSSLDCGPDNSVPNNTIIVRTCDGMQVDLGDANRLTSVEMAGGEAGGGNMTITYNYSSFNVFNVSHDFYQPNHRVLVFEAGNSRFNIGAPRFTRAMLGIF